MTLFVDVDDTLIIYDLPAPNPYGYFQGTTWHINQPLLERIQQFHADKPEAQIIIWSGGGREYGEMWITRLGLSGFAEGMLKDWQSLSLIQDGDIVFDDVDEPWRTHAPDQWPTFGRLTWLNGGPGKVPTPLLQENQVEVYRHPRPLPPVRVHRPTYLIGFAETACLAS